jgi:hypothetical protein
MGLQIQTIKPIRSCLSLALNFVSILNESIAGSILGIVIAISG